MKRPWQIWLLFTLCLAVVLPAMGWLTVKTVQVDQQRVEDFLNTEIARQEAQLQERVSSALWRLDWMLTPLVAKEAARPYFVYQPFYRSQTAPPLTKGQTKQVAEQIPSPLLTQNNNRFVKLHFQIGPKNDFSCPTCPGEDEIEKAIVCGLNAEQLTTSCQTLLEVQEFCDYEKIIGFCSPEPVPAMKPSTDFDRVAFDYAGNPLSEGNAVNVYEINNLSFKQQLAGNFQTDSANQAPAQQVFQSGVPLASNRADQQRAWNKERGGQELQARDRAAKSYLSNEIQTNRWIADPPVTELTVREGVMRPLWIDDKLILARRVDLGTERQVIQCCWLDWEKIEERLLSQISDTLPAAKLEPLYEDSNVQVGRALATLPVQIVAGLENLPAASIQPLPIELQGGWFSGLRLSLVLAWVGLLAGASAVGLLLHGVIKLSERRGTFVSAVTHELRTPLTTFRMYAEMLAEKMLPSDKKRQEYANTLRVEADRLSHLVENVLQFARLERGCQGGQKEILTVDSMVERFAPRLKSRAEEAGMALAVHCDKSATGQEIYTAPAAVEHVLFNLVDNACKYARDAEDKRIELSCAIENGYCEYRVRDFGPGVDRKKAKQLFQPFRKSDQEAANSAAGVGLGLALSRKLARDLRGELRVDPVDGAGANFVLRIPLK